MAGPRHRGDLRLDVLPEGREGRVEGVARTVGHVDVAVPGDVGEELGVAIGAVDVGGRGRRVEAVALCLPGEHRHEGRALGSGRESARVRPQQGDPDGAVVVALRVAATYREAREVVPGDRLARSVLAAVAALVDVAGGGDEGGVADVAPAADHGVVVVDRPNGRGRVRIVVGAGRVVD